MEHVDMNIAYSMPLAESTVMGLAPGGRMKQEIFEDPYDYNDWDRRTSSRCFVHLANSLVWRQVTGADPPTVPLTAEALRNIPAEGSSDMRFASAVAAFGQWLRDGSYTDDFGPDGIVRLAESATKGSGDPYKSEFVELVRLAGEMESIR